MILVPVDITKRYFRVSIRPKSAFKKSSFRTQDVGRKGHTKRLSGILRKNGKYATKTWLFNLKDIKKRDPKTISTLRRVARDSRMKMQVTKSLRKLM